MERSIRQTAERGRQHGKYIAMNILDHLSMKWKITLLLAAPVAGLGYSAWMTNSWIPMAFALTGIIVGLFVDHGICKSLKEIEQALKGIAKGNYDPFIMTSASDEVGQLAQVLESVQESIHGSQVTSHINEKMQILAQEKRNYLGNTT